MSDCTTAGPAIQSASGVGPRSPERGGPGSAGGLSNAHIPRKGKTQKQIDREILGAFKVSRIVVPGSIKVYSGGGLIEVKKTHVLGMGSGGGGVRGEIKTFSRGSRRRFMNMMGKIKSDVVPLFVTLTYPDAFPKDLETQSKHFERLRSRLQYKGAAAIWRREYVTRKSGESVGQVAPHYHFIVWGMDYINALCFFAHAWYECCGKICPEHLTAGTRVEKIKSWRGVRSYASKYMAKIEELGEGQGVGRFWGVVNRAGIPWADCIEGTLDDPAVNQLFRYMRRYSGMPARNVRTYRLLCDNPGRWLRLARIC